MAPSSAMWAGWDAALPAQRARLVRYCYLRTGSQQAAEDLAQETLFEAWRHRHELHDPAGLDRWLGAIARNVCHRWGRTHGRELAHSAPRAPVADDDVAPFADRWADDVDIEVDLERAELIDLLDRALALLPPDTRQVLVQRYIDESPQAEIARRLGVSEGAVEARLQRGKLTLRRALATTFHGEAAAFGLVEPTAEAWRPTRLWCPACGRRHLDGYFRPEQGVLRLRCPGCLLTPRENWHFLDANVGNALLGLHTLKPALSRCLGLIHELFQIRANGGAVRCPSCQALLPIRRQTWPATSVLGDLSESFRVRCAHCRTIDDHESWHSLTWSLPEVRRFWQEHPRMRFLPGRAIEANGSPAVVTGFESLTDSTRIEVVSLRATGKALSVNGRPMSRDVVRP